MKGRRVAWGNEKVLAYMIYNKIGKHSISRVKRMARREDRRYQKKIFNSDIFLLD